MNVILFHHKIIVALIRIVMISSQFYYFFYQLVRKKNSIFIFNKCVNKIFKNYYDEFEFFQHLDYLILDILLGICITEEH